MIYLDSNVFLFAALHKGDTGNHAKALLKGVQSGALKAATSTLTYDEVYWSVRKHRGREDALRAGEALLGMSNLSVLDVTLEVVWGAQRLLEVHNLGPRDAIHAACAISKGIRTMVSEDPDFDRVKVIKRTTLKDFKLRRRK
jgi:predicted nucleic acid-binding protein